MNNYYFTADFNLKWLLFIRFILYFKILISNSFNGVKLINNAPFLLYFMNYRTACWNSTAIALPLPHLNRCQSGPSQ